MKKIYDCEFLKKGLHFTQDNLRFCCAPTYWGPNIDTKNPDSKDVFQALTEIRKKSIEEMKEHIIPQGCKGCFYLKEYDSDSFDTPQDIIENQNKEPLISYIIINHFRHCDCHCIYCIQQEHLKKIITRPQKSEYYDLFPIIKQFYKEKLIDFENLQVEFQGGSVNVLKEFPDLVKIFLKNGVSEIRFYINGIKFLPQIVDASKKCDTKIICSLDAGTRETFKRMKLVDKFDDVIKNLKRYREKAANATLNTKYILIEGINDNKEELSKFFDVIEYIGANVSQLDIDFKKIMLKSGVRYDIPKHYHELFDFFREECQKRNIYPNIWEYIQNVLDKGYFV